MRRKDGRRGRWTTVFTLADKVAELQLWGMASGQLLETANDSGLYFKYVILIR